MPINILMPALSPTMEKGNLAKWLKKEGDAVKTGDVIAEIETDKATMEYEAVDDGVMAKIVVPEGTSDVPVNQLIAVMAQEGEDVKAAAAAAGKGRPPRKRRAHRRIPRRAAPRAAPRRSRQRRPQPRLPQPRRKHRAETPRSQRSRAGPRLLLAARQTAGEGSRHRYRPHPGFGSPRPRHCPRCRGGEIRPGLARAERRAGGRRRACRSRRRCRTSKSDRSTKRAATTSCRTTACAAPSRSGSPPRCRRFRIST